MPLSEREPEPPSVEEIQSALRSDAYPAVSEEDLARTEPHVLAAAARFGRSWTPTAPEFRIKHDSGGCNQEIVWGFIRPDEDEGDLLELQCDGCDDTWETNVI